VAVQRARWGGTLRYGEEMRTMGMGCGGDGRGCGPFYRIREGEVRRHRGGGWPTMVGIQFLTVSRSTRVWGVDGR
jgi:hypothetical protein